MSLFFSRSGAHASSASGDYRSNLEWLAVVADSNLRYGETSRRSSTSRQVRDLPFPMSTGRVLWNLLQRAARKTASGLYLRPAGWNSWPQHRQKLIFAPIGNFAASSAIAKSRH